MMSEVIKKTKDAIKKEAPTAEFQINYQENMPAIPMGR